MTRGRGASTGGLPAGAEIAGWLLLAVPLLAWAAIRVAGAMNPDGIAYVRLGGYWASGRVSLAVSGYWGPFLPWLMVPFRWLGLSPLAAGRAAIVVSALVFVAGGTAFLRVVLPGNRAARWAGGVLVLAAVAWSVPAITPDLLLGGLLAFALSALVARGWPDRPRLQVLAGAVLGAAYLAKAVAFPLAVLFTLGLAGVRSFSGEIPARRAGRAAVLTLLAFGCVAAPWVATLSAKYGGFVFSTSGGLNHALVGPGASEPVHPYRVTLHDVEPGRITAWEDPSRMPYRRWFPFDGPREFRHQVRLSLRNCREALDSLAGLDLLRFAPALLLAGLLFHRPFRENLRVQRWRWSGLPAALLVLIYLPVQASSTRYFWPVLPLALAAGLGLVDWIVEPGPGRSRLLAGLVAGLLLLDFAGPALADLPGRLAGARNPEVVAAREIAGALEQAGIREPVVGGGHVGLYAAFLLERPWEGDLAAHPWTPEVARRAVRLLEEAGRRRVLVAWGEEEVQAVFRTAGFVPVPMAAPVEVRGVPVRTWLVPGDLPGDLRPAALTAPPAAEDDSGDGAIGPAGESDTPGTGRAR